MKPITPQIWLERFNFHGNPFSSLEAGSEDDAILNQYFVAPPYFDEILGNAKEPKTMLVFAPRGGGKTAQRMMVHYYCQHELTNETVLSVPYTNFNAILEHSEINRDITCISIRHHIEEILPRIVQSLLTFLAHEPIRGKILAKLSKDKKAYLGWLMWHYQKYLSVEQRGDLDQKILLQDNDIPQNIKFFLRSKAQAPPVEHLKDFSALLKEQCDIDAIYLLVDGVDEFYETASDIHGAIALIEPLLADLTSMELPCVAFKFFLPLEMEPLLRNRPAVRFDRLGTRRIERWDDESLLEIVHRRLQAFSHSYESLDAVCVPELRGRLEREMVSLADGTPRNLIRLGNYLLQEHAKLLKSIPKEEAIWLISEQAWKNAEERFRSERQTQWSEPVKESSEEITEIKALIAQGESKCLEFKSTLSWDIRQGKQNAALKKVIAKTLCGFMNAKGGTLLIGVNDQGEILGLEDDFSSLRRRDTDNDIDIFRQALVNIVTSYIGVSFYEYIHSQFKEIHGDIICIVDVMPSPDPVYLRDGEKREFYVRVDNVTRPLNVEQTTTYIRRHWNS